MAKEFLSMSVSVSAVKLIVQPHPKRSLAALAYIQTKDLNLVT